MFVCWHLLCIKNKQMQQMELLTGISTNGADPDTGHVITRSIQTPLQNLSDQENKQDADSVKLKSHVAMTCQNLCPAAELRARHFTCSRTV